MLTLGLKPDAEIVITYQGKEIGVIRSDIKRTRPKNAQQVMYVSFEAPPETQFTRRAWNRDGERFYPSSQRKARGNSK
jgi:hypothetical protein